MSRAFARRITAAVLLLALALVPACSKSSTTTTAPPPPPPGGGPELNSGSLSNGGQYRDTLQNTGNFPYHCQFHSQMQGSVNVTAAAPSANVSVSITDFAFSPSTVQVQPGGVVTWTNNGNSAHTVTSN